MSHHPVPRWLDVATTAAIAVNVGAAAWGLLDHNEMAEHIESATLVFFGMEIALRLRLLGWRAFARNKWNVIDAVVVILASLPIVTDALVAMRLVRLARAVHLLRHVAHFRVVTRFQIWQLKRRFAVA